jgi:hypothetical protein
MQSKIKFRVSNDEKNFYKDIAKKNNVSLTELIKISLEEKCFKKGFMKNMEKRHKIFVRKMKFKKALKNTKETKHELYTLKNVLKSIWDICNTDYALKREINMDKVDLLRKEALKIYNGTKPCVKELLKKDFEFLLSLDRISIITGLDSKRRNLKTNNEVIYIDEEKRLNQVKL